MKKIIVLGGGLVGGPMAIDLAEEKAYDVTVADVSDKVLHRLSDKYRIKTLIRDLSSPETIKDLIKDYDFVLNALPGFIGFQTLKAVIEAGKNTVDISFFPEDPFVLDALAKKQNITALMDCGVAPGMSFMLIGNVYHLLDRTNSVALYVGGLPEIKEWPFEYKAVFSPADVIEEYLRPARCVVNSKLVIKPALSEVEHIEFPGIGKLEAFNTDGLRSLASTLKIPNMKEKTLRYPGHAEKIQMLKESGFLSNEAIKVGNTSVTPLAFTSQVLFKKWKLNEGERDITVMKIIIEGEKEGKSICYSYSLLDRYDEKTGTHSMARVTGYTATTALRMIEKGIYAEKGLIVPEYIGKHPECIKYMLKGLEERGVVYREVVS